MTPTSVSEWTREKLVGLNHADALELFKSLPSVAFDELEGEYAGDIPDGGDEAVKRMLAQGIFNEETPFGCWLGKAVTRTSETAGEGYNYCRKAGRRIIRHLRYATDMDNSYVDGTTVFTIRYAAFKNGSGERDLVDEVRRVGDGLYLCVSTTRNDDGSRSAPGLFILSGPSGPWVGVDDKGLEARVD